MTPTPHVALSRTRPGRYDWWIADADTGRELDAGTARDWHAAHAQARRALADCERRMGDGRPTEAVETDADATEARPRPSCSPR